MSWKNLNSALTLKHLTFLLAQQSVSLANSTRSQEQQVSKEKCIEAL